MSFCKKIYIKYISRIKFDFILQSKRSGIKYLLWMSDYTSRKIFLGSCLECKEMEFIKEEVKEGDACIDVGANIGYYTLNLAKLVGDTGKVFSFEPNRRNYLITQLASEINSFKNVFVSQCVVSESNGVKYSAVSGIDSTTTYYVEGSNGAEQASTVSIDEYLKSSYPNKKIKLLKIDTEGAELTILRGAEKLLLSKNAPDYLLIECCDSFLSRFNASAEMLFDYLISLGYSNMFFFDKKGNKSVLDRNEFIKYEGNLFVTKNV